MILLHASCVAVDGTGILLRGPSGAGKSDLALRLIDAGAELVADDYCEVIAADGRLTATAPALIAGKIEIRGFGIASLPARASAPIALVVDLAPMAEIARMPDETTCVVAGVTLPWVRLDPTAASAVARLRLILRQPAVAQQVLIAAR